MLNIGAENRLRGNGLEDKTLPQEEKLKNFRNWSEKRNNDLKVLNDFKDFKVIKDFKDPYLTALREISPEIV